MNYLEEKIETVNGDLAILMDNIQFLTEDEYLQCRVDRLKEKLYILYTHLTSRNLNND